MTFGSDLGGKMVRTELVEALAVAFPELDRQAIEKIVSLFFEEIVARLSNGGRVELRGFGSFTVRTYEPRTGRNPKNGETVEVSASSRTFFKPGKPMLKRLNATVDI
jgi:integration host factor subunit beta